MAANFDATKLKGAVQQGADLISKLMTVDWTSTTDNAPVHHTDWTSTTDCGDPQNDEICNTYTRTHDVVIDRDASDMLNHDVLSNGRDFLNIVDRGLSPPSAAATVRRKTLKCALNSIRC